MKSLPFVSPHPTRRGGRRGARVAASLALACAATLALGACTPAAPAPSVTGAPDTTSVVVRVAALGGDSDALLQARASVEVLKAAGVKARLADPATLSARQARSLLADDKVDLVYGGAEEWLLAERDASGAAPGTAATPRSTAATASSSTPSGGPETDGSAGSTPNDQGSATDAVSASLEHGLAVGTAALAQRRLAAVTTAAIAAEHTLDSVATLPAFCQESRLAAPKDWVDAAGTAWESRSGCAPRDTMGAADAASALELLSRGSVELAITRSNDPRILAWGLRSLEDPSNTLGSDPLLGVISTDRVGKDALGRLTKLAAALGGENWDQLQRLEAESGVSDADLTAWLTARSLLSEAGAPTAPSAS